MSSSGTGVRKPPRRTVTKAVLDTSAVLAGFFSEPGADAVLSRGDEGIISTVSYSEALAKLRDRGVPLLDAEYFLGSLNLTEAVFDHQHAVLAASLRERTRLKGLSFADRACLACASLQGCPVLTADRDWKDVDAGVEVILIRN
jgi:PIN domain nuclease of toxin-antitoxin system